MRLTSLRELTGECLRKLVARLCHGLARAQAIAAGTRPEARLPTFGTTARPQNPLRHCDDC